VPGVTSDEDFVTDSSFVKEWNHFVLQNLLSFLLAGKGVDDNLKIEDVVGKDVLQHEGTRVFFYVQHKENESTIHDFQLNTIIAFKLI